MKPFRWNHAKNEALKIERGISFEEIVLAIEADGLLDILRHPNPAKYQNQSVLVVVSVRSKPKQLTLVQATCH